MKLNVDHIDNQNAGALLEDGLAALNGGDTVVDLSSVLTSDSAGIALLLALRRAAVAAGVDLTFLSVPVSLCNLASLYGIDTLLPGIAGIAAVAPVATPG